MKDNALCLAVAGKPALTHQFFHIIGLEIKPINQTFQDLTAGHQGKAVQNAAFRLCKLRLIQELANVIQQRPRRHAFHDPGQVFRLPYHTGQQQHGKNISLQSVCKGQDSPHLRSLRILCIIGVEQRSALLRRHRFQFPCLIGGNMLTSGSHQNGNTHTRNLRQNCVIHRIFLCIIDEENRIL